MAPFQWQAPPQGDVGTITDLMLRGPEAVARAAEVGGQARAAAQANSGAIWGNTISNLGQIAADVPNQIAANQDRQVRTQEAKMRLDTLKRDFATRQAFSTALKDPTNRTDQGTIDWGKVSKQLMNVNPDAALMANSYASALDEHSMKMRKDFMDLQSSQLSLNDKQRAAQQLVADQIGRIAYHGEQLMKENPTKARDIALAGLARAGGDGLIPESAAQKTALEWAGLGPDDLRARFASLVPDEMRGKLDKEAADEKHVSAETAHLEAESANLRKFGRLTPSALQDVDVMLNGKPHKRLTFNPDSNEWYLPGTRTPIDMSKNTVDSNPPASIIVNNAIAGAAANAPAVDASRPSGPSANLPESATGLTPNAIYQESVSHALTGKMPSVGLGQSPRAQAVRSTIMNKAGALAAAAGTNQATLQSEYRANSTALNKLVPQAQATANFANTARDNLDLAMEQSSAVQRSGSKLANRYTQWAQGELTPAAGLTKFETYVYTAAREYAKVTSGGALSAQGLTDSAQREAAKLLNTAQSPEAFSAAVDAMKNDMANVIGEQSKGIARVSSVLGGFFNAVNGGNEVNDAPPKAPPKKNPFR